MLNTARTFSFEYNMKEADIFLLGVPFTSTQIGQPVKHGPLFIREAIKNLVGWDPELKLNIFEKLKFTDLGDIEIVPGSWELTSEAITETLEQAYQENPKAIPILLGGEHLITLAAVNFLADKLGSLTIVHLDAHRDLKEDWVGNRYSHISWANLALKNPKIKLVQPACRIWDTDEEETFKKLGVKETLEGISGPVYLTVDLDVLDPSIAPEVGTQESNGLSLMEALEIIKQTCEHKLVGMDIVECASERVNTQTALAAAIIFKKTLGYRSLHGNR